MLKAVAAVSLIVITGVGVVMWQRRAAPLITREIVWAGKGVWLKAETHVHTKFSDGSHTVDEVADRAVANGCDVLAITDHTDSGLKAATPDYHAALAAARARLPGLVLLTGFEWNVPPGKGQDHAVVLIPPGLDGEEVWSDFKRRFDDLDKEGENPELAVDAVAWMRALAAEESAGPPVVFLNHPSRRAPTVAAVGRQLEFLAGLGDGAFAGVEGAPGHQKATPLGAYGGALTPDDRWDPSIAPPGGAWDRRLAARQQLWGALATSDFHSEGNGDYWPCQFSTTWVYARERSAAAVLAALREGAFAGVHGGIASKVQLTLTAAGLPREAIAGEAVRLPKGTDVSLELRGDVPTVDWEGQPNRVDLVEFVIVPNEGAAVVQKAAPADGVWRHRLPVPTGGMVVRARGRRVVEDGPDLQFYTNPIFVN